LALGSPLRLGVQWPLPLLEAQLALATMVQHARLRVLPKKVEPEPLVTLRLKGGMPAIVERVSWRRGESR
jgi:hypothetical protein